MTTISLQPLKENDLELLMAWRSHPTTYHFFLQQQGPLKWEEHYTFWKNRKNREDLLIILQDEEDNGGKRKVGSLNLSALNTSCPEMGILIGETSLHGQGIGSRAVKLGLDRLKNIDHHRAVASVHKDNHASQIIFEKNQFILGENENDLTWKKYFWKDA